MTKETPKSPKTVTGLPENTEAALTYLLGWLSGLLFLLIEKDNQKIRFHALQSIVMFGVIPLVFIILGSFSLVPIIGWLLIPLLPLLWIAVFILWLVLIVKAYQGEQLEIPVVGKFVKKQLNIK